MKTLNTQTIDKPYIDQDYYTNIFKPNKNAMLIGSFNNVTQHVADFDAFRNRASELVDRLVSNKVTEVGGIDFVSPTPQMFLKKAVASIVQHWFIAGYVPNDINNAINIGSLNITRVMQNPTFRKYVPFDAILLIQKSGLADMNYVGIDLTKRLSGLGIDVKDILLMSDALKVFQQKNKYDDNFHIDIDYSSELTNQAIDRWIKVVETTKNKISFEITGGSQTENARALIFIDKADFTAGNTEAYIYSTKLLAQDQKPDYYVKNDNGTLSVYIKVADNIPSADAHFLISNIYADDAGEYKLFGSQTNDTNLTVINKANILQSADLTILNQKLTNIEQQIQAIQGTTAQVATNKTDIALLKADNITNKRRIGDVESKANTNEGNIASNVTTITENTTKVNYISNKAIKKDGSVAFDNGYTPSVPQSPATKKIVDNLETKLRTEFQALSGYETEWEGNLSFIKVPNSQEGQADTSVLTPQTGGSFNYVNNKKIFLSFEAGDYEETITTRIGNDNKWDDVKTVYKSSGSEVIIQFQLQTNGNLKLRAIDKSGNIVNWADIPEVPQLVAMYQITGNVYTSPNITVDDTKITELEGVTI